MYNANIIDDIIVFLLLDDYLLIINKNKEQLEKITNDYHQSMIQKITQNHIIYLYDSIK